MTSYHNQPEMYHDHPASRSPGSHRHQPQTLHRQPSRQFDAYGPMPTAPAYATEDPMARYDTGRMDRLNFTHTMHNSQFGTAGQFGYDMGGASTWNPNGNGFPTAATLNPMAATSRMKPPRGRTGIPTTWLDQQSGMPQYSGLGPSPLGAPQIRHDSMGPDLDDELIPTAIVIKNIPFAVKKEQLVALLTEMNLPLPYAFNYHFDNGVFRGLAFANFTSADETAAVIEVLNHFELQGRKLRVEYKKMLPLQERERIEREKRERRGQLEEQHRPMTNPQLHSQTSMSSLSSHMPATSPSPVSQRDGKPGVDLNEPQTLEFYTQLVMFKSDFSKESLIFPAYLTPEQRRTVHTLAHQLGLGHVSRGEGGARQVHVTRAQSGSNVSPPNPTLSTINASDAARRGLNRAATIDFGEQRGSDHSHFNTLRGQGSAGLLGIADFNQQNLRAAKSFADLRSYTPSPVPSSASFPVVQPNGRFGPLDTNVSGSTGTPTLTPTASASGLGFNRDEGLLVNGMGNMSLGTNIVGPTSSSPRRLRGLFSWDQEAQQNQSQFPATAPIGSNRGTIGGNFDNNQSQERSGAAGPLRQPRGPAERGPGFRRQNGHPNRGSDEMRGNSGVEIIVE